jgi:uncharacterized protein YjbJ (UPF0337 family)
MNKDQVQGNWDHIKGKARKLWGELTEDDIERAKGSVESLIGTIQSKFGDAREEIQRKLEQLK